MRRCHLAIIVFIFLFSQSNVFSQPFTILKDINYGGLGLCLGSPQPLNLTESGGSIFFSSSNITTAGLWKTDGSNTGTSRVKEISGIGPLKNLDGLLLFAVGNPNLGQTEIWKSDGTEAGTVLIKSWLNRTISEMTTVNRKLYFRVSVFGNSDELWESDGTEEGTKLIKSLGTIQNLKNIGGTLFFLVDDAPLFRNTLWKSDGTENGTVMVKDIYAGSGSVSFSSFFDANGVLYFIGNDGVHGLELWKSDGTNTGTQMIKDIEPGVNGSNIKGMALMNNSVWFLAKTTANGDGLWKTDGTDAGTLIIKDLIDGGSPDYLTAVDNTLFFKGHDGELWKSDGTDAGTVLVKDVFPGGASNPASLFNANGTLFFSATNTAFVRGDMIECYNNGGELWKSDGTESGTVLVKDIYNGNGGTGGPDQFIMANGILFFKANNGLNGRELWKTDGTTGGTSMVMDINTTKSSNPKKFTSMNGLVYFTAFNQDGGPSFARGTEVYQTDGTLSGTNQSTWIF